MEISVNELLKNNNLNIIDIRNSYSYNKGHIPGAINIEVSDLLSNLNYYLERNKIYYFYCDYGNRSKNLVKKLSSLGYKAVNIIGGYNNYLFRK